MGIPPPPPLEKICNSSLDNVGWDRFDFLIRLEYVEYPRRLADEIMWLCVRFTAESVGEWWDNNNGANYRVVFKFKFKKEVVGGEA
ncbi:hypothetical protein EXIGLDRAFT_835088 [Exidia glandulosa HHB12029]|uniref:CBM21 domain-containing protein n=1 Tax=Exidia glandulosa HHB12029 TaxID=1314781 RepID=A0A165J4C4_EXIGL|nr:hypothetical protein EXIGLDRAFT_835088 [Exidia glandulosa HHB12029]